MGDVSKNSASRFIFIQHTFLTIVSQTGVGRLNSNCQFVDKLMRSGKPDPSSGDQCVADVVQIQAPPTLVSGMDALDGPTFWQDDGVGERSVGRLRLLGLVSCATCRIWA